MGKGGGGGLCVLAALCAFLLPLSSDAAASRSAFLNKKSWHPGGFKQARFFTAPTRCVSHGLRAMPPTARGCVEARAGEGAGGEAAGGAEEADCRGARSARASSRRAGGWPCYVRAPRVRFPLPCPDLAPPAAAKLNGSSSCTRVAGRPRLKGPLCRRSLRPPRQSRFCRCPQLWRRPPSQQLRARSRCTSTTRPRLATRPGRACTATRCSWCVETRRARVLRSRSLDSQSPTSHPSTRAD